MDEDLRALERLAAAGDGVARLRLQHALVRARRPLDVAWRGLSVVLAGDVFERLASLSPAGREELEGDLASIDPVRLLAHHPRGPGGEPVAEVGLAAHASSRWQLVARAAGGGLQVALAERRGQCCPRWTWDARCRAVATALAARSASAVAAATSDGLVLWNGEVVARGRAPIVALRQDGEGRPLAVFRSGGLWRGDEPLDVPLPDGVLTAAFAPGGRALAFTDGDSLGVVDLAERRVRWRLPHARYAERAEVTAIHALAFSGDGALLAQASGAAIVRDAATGEPRFEVLHGRESGGWEDNKSSMGLARDRGAHESWPSATWVAWVDPRRLATRGASGPLCVWTLGAHARQGVTVWSHGDDTSSWRTPEHAADCAARIGAPLAASPDGRWLFGVNERGVGQVLRVGRTLDPGPALEGRPVSAAFTADGRGLVVGTDDGEVRVHDRPPP